LVTDKQPPRRITDWPPDESLLIDFLNSVYSGHTSGLSLRDIYRVNEIVLAARDSADQHRFIQL